MCSGNISERLSTTHVTPVMKQGPTISYLRDCNDNIMYSLDFPVLHQTLLKLQRTTMRLLLYNSVLIAFP